MNQHNKEIIDCIERVRIEIKIGGLIASEFEGSLGADPFYRLFNLYSMLDMDDLIKLSKENSK